MKLTEERKKLLDAQTYQSLLRRWRFMPVGDPWFEGETGDYWAKRMEELRNNGADHVSASKATGWMMPAAPEKFIFYLNEIERAKIALKDPELFNSDWIEIRSNICQKTNQCSKK